MRSAAAKPTGWPATPAGAGPAVAAPGRVLEQEPFGGRLWIEIEGQHRAPGTPLARLALGVAQS